MQYKGVVYRAERGHWQPRVTYKRQSVWLKTFLNPEAAARVRDIADYWVRAGNSKQNFRERMLPAGVTEAEIARWLLEGGVPLKLLLQRVPAPILSNAGVTDYDLLMAGVDVATVLQRPMKCAMNYSTKCAQLAFEKTPV